MKINDKTGLICGFDVYMINDFILKSGHTTFSGTVPNVILANLYPLMSLPGSV